MKVKAKNFEKPMLTNTNYGYMPRSTCFADMFAAKKVMEPFGESQSL